MENTLKEKEIHFTLLLNNCVVYKVLYNNVPRTRVERVTFPLGGECSIQLSYRGIVLIISDFQLI